MQCKQLLPVCVEPWAESLAIAAQQVKKIFKRARIVGKRYPIVHVYEGAVINEVSSFTTNTEAMFVPQDIEGLMEAKVGSACR